MSPRPSIVVVDDATDVRQLVKTHLRLSGRLEVVGEGADGDEAIDLARVHRPELMLLDVSMPCRDGLAALPLVLDASPTTRVVMFSGFEEAGLGDHTRALGASDFVEKSVPLDELVERLVAVARAADGDVSAGRGVTVRPGPGAGPDLDPVLADHLERFREIFEDAAIGMATLTLDGRMVRVNRHLAALLDYPPDDLVGVPYAEVTSQASAVRTHLDLVRQDGTAVELEHGLSHNATSWVRATVSAVLDAGGAPLYLFLQVQDITDQRTAEAELARTEQRFRLLVEAVQDYAIFMLDPQGHIASWNAGAQRSKGYAAEEIIGHHFRIFYPPEKQRERHPEHELEIASREGSYEEEGWRVRKDGSTFWAHVTITAVHDDHGDLVGFAKVTRDASERRRLVELQEEGAKALAEANRSLAQANGQLRRAAEEQADFLAVTAHELRSPVGVLAGSADTLARHLDRLTAEERVELAEGIRRSASQLRRLLDDLLTVSRAEAGTLQLRPASLSVDEQLQRQVVASRQAWPETTFVLEQESGARVLVDPGRFSQMLDNLVANAAQHGLPPVRLGATSRDGTVEISVRDAGAGVAPEARARLFERFGATTGGTGLGLYIVRELARAHGGDVAYRETDAAFVLALPAHGEGPS